MKKRTCSCGSSNLETHSNGSLICTECGKVFEENQIVNEVNFVSDGGGGNVMLGNFIADDGLNNPLRIGWFFLFNWFRVQSSVLILSNQIKSSRSAKFSWIDAAEGQRCYKTFSSTAKIEGIRLERNFIPAQNHISGPSYRRSIQLLSPCLIKIINSWPTCRTDLCFMRLLILSNRFYWHRTYVIRNGFHKKYSKIEFLKEIVLIFERTWK